MDKVAKKKNEKYNRLIDSAFELFEKSGTHLVSIDEIVKSAGVAKGTFYLYFHDKHDLISKLILDKATKFMGTVSFRRRKITSYDEFEEYLKSYLNYLCEFLETNKTLTLLIDKNVNVCVNALVETTEGPLYDLYDEIRSYLIESGFSEEMVTVKLYLYIEMVISSCCNAILREHPYSLSKVKLHLFEMVTHCIRGAKLTERLDYD